MEIRKCPFCGILPRHYSELLDVDSRYYSVIIDHQLTRKCVLDGKLMDLDVWDKTITRKK